jgi:hypothetical protein
VVLAVALGGALVFTFRPAGSRVELADNLRQAERIAAACRAYAMDNQGAYPPTLERLDPDYLSAIALRELAYRSEQGRQRWIYFPGHHAESSREIVILASPADGKHGQRVILRADLSGEIVSEGKFQRMLQEQRSH